MRKLKKPEDLPKDVFNTCISNMRENDLKRRLRLCESAIVDASIEFDLKASNAMLHTIAISNNVAGEVSVAEMENVYTQKMVPQDSPGRIIYDKLISAPDFGRCPLCGQRIVSTLDHHLPKARYPALAVTPFNLVPSCQDCNKTKLAMTPIKSEEETLHPYYDNIEGDYWLYCRVVENNPVSLLYFVDPPGNWSEILRIRIENHFNVFHLAELYSTYAAEELANIYFSLQNLNQNKGENGVRNHLYEEAVSRARSLKNSWQTAMYRALANSDWFCTGGFNSI